MTENLAKKKILKNCIGMKQSFIIIKRLLFQYQSSKSYLKELYGKDWKVKKKFF